MHGKDPLRDWADIRLFLAILEQGSQVAAAEHLGLTQELGVRSTPQFWIDGENIQGANIPALESAIAPAETIPGG